MSRTRQTAQQVADKQTYHNEYYGNLNRYLPPYYQQQCGGGGFTGEPCQVSGVLSRESVAADSALRRMHSEPSDRGLSQPNRGYMLQGRDITVLAKPYMDHPDAPGQNFRAAVGRLSRGNRQLATVGEREYTYDYSWQEIHDAKAEIEEDRENTEINMTLNEPSMVDDSQDEDTMAEMEDASTADLNIESYDYQGIERNGSRLSDTLSDLFSTPYVQNNQYLEHPSITERIDADLEERRTYGNSRVKSSVRAARDAADTYALDRQMLPRGPSSYLQGYMADGLESGINSRQMDREAALAEQAQENLIDLAESGGRFTTWAHFQPGFLPNTN